MNNKYKKLTFNTILFSIGLLGSKAISFFMVPLYTNVLSTGEYGTADLISTLSSLLLPLFSLSMGESILYFGLKAKDEADKEKLFKNGFTVVLIGCLFLIILSPLFLLYKSLDGFTWFLPLYAICEIIRNYLKLYTKSREKNLIYTVDNICYSLIFATLNILFLVVLKFGVSGYLFAHIISELISAVFLLVYNKGFSNCIRYRIDKGTVKKMIIFSAPLILNSISWAISASSDKIMIDMMIGTDLMGIYSTASKLPSIANTIINLFCQAWTISTYLEIENGDKHFYTNVFNMFNTSLLLVISIILFISRPFMYIYVGESFREAANYVPFLLISCAFQSYGTYFGTIIQSGGKNMFMLISTMVAAIFNVIANYILIMLVGVYGACIATALSFLIIFVLRFKFSKKVFDFPINLTNLCGSLIVLTLQALFVTLNYHVIAVSIISILLLIFLNFAAIKSFILKLKNKLVKNER